MDKLIALRTPCTFMHAGNYSESLQVAHLGALHGHTCMHKSCVKLAVYACYKHNEWVDIDEKLVYTLFKLLKMATNTTNCALSIQHACSLSTTSQCGV